MRILHTSDWHLGQHFIHRDRKKEHRAFLNWLLKELNKNEVDLLIVAGDIFDTGTPPNYAQELYYNFLSRVRKTCCRHIIITGGNHDSVSMLKAPKILLKYMNIHIIESISSDIEDDIIEITDGAGKPEALVCAVPYLRDRDIRRSIPGETYRDKNLALLNGVKNYYTRIKEKALEIVKHKNIPLLATGHLFTAGGETSEGVRDIYVGSLGKIEASSFPAEFDYLALGHLHKPQKVGGREHIRYSGSPIPLSFGEADTPKEVLLVDISTRGETPVITPIKIPVFRKLMVIKGSVKEIEKALEQIEDPGEEKKVWLEIQISRADWRNNPGADARIKELCSQKPVELFAIKLINDDGVKILKSREMENTLDHLKPEDVFNRRLEEEKGLDEELAEDLRHRFNEILQDLHLNEEDR